MWPFSRRTETREAEGGYTGIISALIGAQAAGTTQQASATAATEAVAGALSRAFADARVDGPPDIAEALSPRTLAQIGRDLVRVGESLHVIRMSGGQIRLFPASTWYWEGGADPADWMCTATVYGPSGSSTWRLPQSSVVFVTWGAPTARPYHGLSPGTWAADTSRLTANAERSLANEAGGPVAQLLPVPQDGGDGAEDGTDPLSGLKSDIKDAKGSALLVETTSGGWGEGAVNAPRGRLEAAKVRADAARGDGQACGVRLRAVARGGRLLGLPCSTTRTARQSARRCGNGIWASCARSPGCWSRSCRRNSAFRSR